MATPTRRSALALQSLFKAAEFARVSKWVAFGVFVGVVGGFVGIGFEWLVSIASQLLLRGPVGISGEGVAGVGERWWLVLAIPAAGGLATGFLIHTFSPESEGHGTDSVILAFHKARGLVRARVVFFKAITSAITIGTGGSAGQEGPICQIGSGVGSSIANLLKLSDRDRRILLLCGAAAGLGAIFRAPLGGALFLTEVLYNKEELEGEAIVPCIIAAIFAYVTYTSLTGDLHAIHLSPQVLENLHLHGFVEIPAYIVLAILCTLFGRLYVRSFYAMHDGFKRLPVPGPVRPALGGLALGALALAIAPLSGETGILFGGYGLVDACVSGKLAVGSLAVLVLCKILATNLTITSGGSGGVFAPSLAIGACLGAAVGMAGNALFPWMELNTAAFALVGMGGFFAGVAKTPLASVVLVSEMTAGYGLLAPLLLVSTLHLLLSGRRSLYSQQVAGLVDSPAHAGDFVIDVLANMHVRDVRDSLRAPVFVHERTTLREVLRIVADAQASYFPVVDDEERLVGIFSLTDLRRIYLEGVVEDVVIVRDFMVENVVTAHLDDTLDEVLRRMTEHHIHVIPVVENEDDRRVIGLFDRNELGRAYDRRLRELRESV